MSNSFASRVSPALAAIFIALCILSLSASNGIADSSRVPIPDEAMRDAAKRSYSSEELAGYDGTDATKPLLMGVRGLVFDVSPGARFYGPDTSYHALIARDSTRAVARMSLDPTNLNDQCDELSDAEWQFLENVLRDTYLAKYKIVGHVKGGYFFPQGLCCGEDDGACGGC